jgi:protein gp37
MGDTSISWTDKVWNFLAGCARVSAGCDDCYAFRLHNRRHEIYQANGGLWGPGGKPMPRQYALPFETVQVLPERLEAPLHVRQPHKWFVNSMSDLLHHDVPGRIVLQAMHVMRKAHWHRFQILTKRAGRLRRLEWELTRCLWQEALEVRLGEEVVGQLLGLEDLAGLPLPCRVERLLAEERLSSLIGREECEAIRSLEFTWPTNVCPGVSIELDRFTARADALRSLHAHCTMLSLEPLLGPLPSLRLDGIGWVIIGGESGERPRPLAEAWVVDLRDRCLERGIPFYFKQWGGKTAKSGGRLLDGREWNEFPPCMTRTDAGDWLAA